jgi:Matrixin
VTSTHACQQLGRPGRVLSCTLSNVNADSHGLIFDTCVERKRCFGVARIAPNRDCVLFTMSLLRRFLARCAVAALSGVAAIAVLTAPEPALGYCVARTCQDARDGSHECRRSSRGCVLEGLRLGYDSGCLSFAVAAGGTDAIGLTAAQFSKIVERAFERWQEVDCGGGATPGIFVQNAGIVEASTPYSCDGERNQGVWLLEVNWARTRLSDNALGNTFAEFSERTGEIFDADVQLNVEKLLEDAPEGAITEALLAVATHEAGHVLGLDHSDVPAIMATQYAAGELVGRELTPDDIDGICDLWPPEGAPKRCPRAIVPEGALDADSCAAALEEAEFMTQAPAPTDGCSLSAAPLRGFSTAAPFGLGMAALAWILGARRRTPQ